MIMQTAFDVIRWIHIISGFLALSIFWIPIVTKKGGRTHNRAGWIYVYAMGSVAVTAFLMGLFRLAWDAGADADAIPYSWFLMFISVLSAATAWYGLRVLRHKSRKAPHREPADLLFPALLFSSGIGITAYGWVIGFPLLQYFPLLGLFLGGTQLLYWLSTPSAKFHWIVEHIVGMLSCCISTVTAFLVFGAPRLLGVPIVSLLIWMLPTIVMVPLIIGFTRKYKRKTIN